MRAGETAKSMLLRSYCARSLGLNDSQSPQGCQGDPQQQRSHHRHHQRLCHRRQQGEPDAQAETEASASGAGSVG